MLYPMKLTLDDRQELVYPHAFFAAVMNLPYEGGGFRFAPDADPCSDRFTLCIAEGLSKPRILSILPLAFSGRHVGKPGIHLITCKRDHSIGNDTAVSGNGNIGRSRTHID